MKACDVGIPSSSHDWHVPLFGHIGSLLAEGEHDSRKHLKRSGPRRRNKGEEKGQGKGREKGREKGRGKGYGGKGPTFGKGKGKYGR